jgi:hypothetical protein
MVVRLAAESVYNGLGYGECCKCRVQQWASCSLLRIAYRFGAFQMKAFRALRSGEVGVSYNNDVFGFKKDIRAELVWLTSVFPACRKGDSNDVVFPVLFCFWVLQHLV